MPNFNNNRAELRCHPHAKAGTPATAAVLLQVYQFLPRKVGAWRVGGAGAAATGALMEGA